MRRDRGIALMDFVAGSLILAGAVAAWVSITRAQLDSNAFADRRLQARNACERALDDVRAEGPSALADLPKADASGFAVMKRFPVANLPSTLKEMAGRVEARPLKGENAFGAYEVRAVVRWKNLDTVEECELSTILGGKP